MRYLDLSHPLEARMRAYPGDPPLQIEQSAGLDEEGFRAKLLQLHSHHGTHIDAPAHLLRRGATLDQFGVDRFVGVGHVLEVGEANPITIELLEPYVAQISAADFLLLRTGWSSRWGRADYFTGEYPVLTAEAASYVSNLTIKGLGVESASVDRFGDDRLPVHRILLGAEVLILENLRGLEALPATGFELSCFPLPIADADGAPARIIARWNPG